MALRPVGATVDGTEALPPPQFSTRSQAAAMGTAKKVSGGGMTPGGVSPSDAIPSTCPRSLIRGAPWRCSSTKMLCWMLVGDTPESTPTAVPPPDPATR